MSKEEKLVEFLSTKPDVNDELYEEFRPELDFLSELIKYGKTTILPGEKKTFGFCNIDYNIIKFENTFDCDTFYVFHFRKLSIFQEIEDIHLRVFYVNPDTLDSLKENVYKKHIKTWSGIVEVKKTVKKKKREEINSLIDKDRKNKRRKKNEDI